MKACLLLGDFKVVKRQDNSSIWESKEKAWENYTEAESIKWIHYNEINVEEGRGSR